jgi:hypothetical protein
MPSDEGYPFTSVQPRQQLRTHFTTTQLPAMRSTLIQQENGNSGNQWQKVRASNSVRDVLLCT